MPHFHITFDGRLGAQVDAEDTIFCTRKIQGQSGLYIYMPLKRGEDKRGWMADLFSQLEPTAPLFFGLAHPILVHDEEEAFSIALRDWRKAKKGEKSRIKITFISLEEVDTFTNKNNGQRTLLSFSLDNA